MFTTKFKNSCRKFLVKSENVIILWTRTLFTGYLQPKGEFPKWKLSKKTHNRDLTSILVEEGLLGGSVYVCYNKPSQTSRELGRGDGGQILDDELPLSFRSTKISTESEGEEQRKKKGVISLFVWNVFGSGSLPVKEYDHDVDLTTYSPPTLLEGKSWQTSRHQNGRGRVN